MQSAPANDERLWVKVCGTTNLADAQCALAAGADALGFVFAPSPREVTPAEAAAITRQLPPATELIGVFVDASFPEIVQAVEQAGLTGVQLHAPVDFALAQQLRDHFDANRAHARRVSVLQVLHYPERGDGFASALQALEGEPAVDGVLVDSRCAGAQGGTGLRFDWEGARAALAGARSRLRLIVAGGLRPENVGEAVATLRPWGVDVVSGVEAAPGRKDPDRVRAFVQAARAAARKP